MDQDHRTRVWVEKDDPDSTDAWHFFSIETASIWVGDQIMSFKSYLHKMSRYQPLMEVA